MPRKATLAQRIAIHDQLKLVLHEVDGGYMYRDPDTNDNTIAEEHGVTPTVVGKVRRNIFGNFPSRPRATDEMKSRFNKLVDIVSDIADDVDLSVDGTFKNLENLKFKL